MEIKILYDNGKANPDLQEGWGFSALIETERKKILFDTGNDPQAFFSNAEKMSVDLGKITDVVFSHKHLDHRAGSNEILTKLSQECRIYLPKGFPSKLVPQQMQIHRVSDFQEIGSSIFSMVLKGGLFLYEQFLIVQTKSGLVIITGCAHPGIIAILEAAQKKLVAPIHLVLGGFHLFRTPGKDIEKTVKAFQELQVKKVAPCHCSGKLTSERFLAAYQHDFQEIGTGSILKVL